MAVAHTLLLADDSVTIRRVIELTFAGENVRVVSVSSGREAIAGIEASPPDIVLADAGMPDVSGYDIAAFVKGRPDLKHIPVILLAGAFEPLDEARARQSGSDGVLVKPFEPQMAVARVRELLSTVAGQTEPPVAAAVPAPEAAAAPAAPPSVVPSDSALDASLDRLDASFASSASHDTPALDASAATDFAGDRREIRPGGIDQPGFDRQEFGDWDLPLRPAADARTPADDSFQPAPEPARIDPLPPPITLTPEAPQPAYGGAPDYGAPLAEAFNTLLAAEEGRPHGPMPAIFGSTSQAAHALTGQDMDLIVDRLLARLGPDVRGVVLDLAERLVKAEIDRLKALR